MKIVLTSLLIFFFFPDTMAQDNPLRLWYDKPAQTWEEYVPLGNGRLGAMPNGAVIKENIVLNDITLWSGGAQDADKKNASRYLPQIRQLLFDGKNNEAEDLMSRYFVCEGAGSGYGSGAKKPYGSYEILGNLFLSYDYGKDSVNTRPQNYSRDLSLDNALATTKFAIGNTKYSREYFTSFDDDVIIIALTADRLNKINVTLALSRPENYSIQTAGAELQMRGQLTNGTDGNGMRYMVSVTVKLDGGKLITGDSTLQVKDANIACIYISAATDYKEKDYVKHCAHLLATALQKPYKKEKENHVKSFQKLFARATLKLANTSNRLPKHLLPTDKRLEAYAKDNTDNGLAALYFQFGRYLLICSTRPGLLPPNLQGLWANTVETPWNGDYHLNINIQMNHFPLHVTNLAVLNEPFLKLVQGLVIPGEKTAREYYHGNGWVAHVITNIWGYTSPGEHYSWGSANTGSAWLCQMLWSHYEFTKDKTYLQTLYPGIKGSAEFYLSTLINEPTHGWLVTAPSNSPENGFIAPNGKEAHVCEGPTIDNQLIRKLFKVVSEACHVLKTGDSLKQALEKAISLLPPNRIGADGRLMEWLKAYKEVEPSHRHVSHLWGLYPGNEISTDGTPDLAKAAKASLEARGDDGTGWSLAWKMSFWARLHDGNRALLLLGKLLTPVSGSGYSTQGGGAYKNLFSSCPPLQIDGNFGGTAGIAEMLLQSHEEYIEFVPALPGQWKTGSFTGLCVRGGAETSASWVNGKLTVATIKATTDNDFKIKVPANVSKLIVKRDGKTIEGTPLNNMISVSLKKGETVSLNF